MMLYVFSSCILQSRVSTAKPYVYVKEDEIAVFHYPPISGGDGVSLWSGFYVWIYHLVKTFSDVSSAQIIFIKIWANKTKFC